MGAGFPVKLPGALRCCLQVLFLTAVSHAPAVHPGA